MTGGAPVLPHAPCDCALCAYVREANAQHLESRLETLAASFLASRLSEIVDDERKPAVTDREPEVC